MSVNSLSRGGKAMCLSFPTSARTADAAVWRYPDLLLFKLHDPPYRLTYSRAALRAFTSEISFVHTFEARRMKVLKPA